MADINPYVLQFGQEPAQLIPRLSQLNEIETSFFSEGISQHIFMITGVRGTGKTVFLSTANEMCVSKEWIVVNVNISSSVSVLEQILIQLSNHKRIQKHPDYNLVGISAFGFSVELEKKRVASSAEYEVQKLLEIAKKLGYKVLISIDEVTNTSAIREFSGAFQIWIRDKLPVYLLMTGLYENIRELQNEKSLTFLYRCPRIDLTPLQMSAIRENYIENLNVTEDEATAMAKLTKGYSFAFQALGYVVWNLKAFNKEAIHQYKTILVDLSYDKIWDELSLNDRKVCVAIAKSKEGSFKEIKEILDWQGNQLNPYRKRLINKQIIESKGRGFVSFTLPLFDESVLDLEDFLDD